MEEYIEDLFKIYNSSIDSYNAKILQRINSKYTIIDKAMLATYLYIRILKKLKIVKNHKKFFVWFIYQNNRSDNIYQKQGSFCFYFVE